MPNRGAGQEADAWFNTPELAPFANVLAKITTPAASVVRSRFSPVRAIHVPEPLRAHGGIQCTPGCFSEFLGTRKSPR